jgi:hypothetical protein
MELAVKLHAPAALPSGNKAYFGTHWAGGQVGRTAGLEV